MITEWREHIKVKMQIKHIQISYMNSEDIRERRKKSQCVLIPEVALMEIRHLMLQVLKQALAVDVRHAASVLLAIAG